MGTFVRNHSSSAVRPILNVAFLLASILCLPLAAFAKRAVPENLGNGLDKLVESNLAIKAGAPATFNGFATAQAAVYGKMAIVDTATGHYVVDIMPDGRVPLATLQASLQSNFPLMAVKAVDNSYRGHGIIEATVSVVDAAQIAQTAGVGSVILQLKPILNAGQAIAQGVNQHRVNRINKGYNPAASKDYTGTGISVGVMSDSFDASPTTTDRAAADTAADELPSVTVLKDLSFTDQPTDEGRGMCQIVHDVAPGAKIGFATAFGGNVDGGLVWD